MGVQRRLPVVTNAARMFFVGRMRALFDDLHMDQETQRALMEDGGCTSLRVLRHLTPEDLLPFGVKPLLATVLIQQAKEKCEDGVSRGPIRMSFKAPKFVDQAHGEEVKEEPERERPIPCTKCDRRFFNARGLAVHLGRSHKRRKDE